MSQPKKGTKGIVLKLKDALGKDYIKLQKYSTDTSDDSAIALSSSFYERILDIIRQLEGLPIDLSILTETLIGTTVSKLKSCKEEQVSTAAKALIKKWKKMAKEAGMPSGSTSTAKAKGNKNDASKSSNSSVTQKNPNLRKANSTVSAPGSASTTKCSTSEPEQWSQLPQLRKNVCSKMHTILLSSVTITEKNDNTGTAIINLSTEIESSIHSFAKNDRQKYSEKARSLTFNFKKNANLCSQIIAGDILPKNLVTMTPQQLATSEKAKQREDVVKKSQDARRLDWEEANEEKINEMCGIKGELLQASLFTCGRCKSIKTTSTQKQTRSADEPMTVFVFCQNCGNRWKC